MKKLTPEKARWLAERYYKGMEKRDASMAKEFYTEDFVLQDDGAVDLVKGIKEAEAFLQNMYNTWPDLKFQLLKEPCIGLDGVTVAFLVRATSSRKSRRKFTGPTAQWEFASFYTVDLEQEKFCAGRCCFNMLDVYEMLLPIPKRGSKLFRKLEKMFAGKQVKKEKK